MFPKPEKKLFYGWVIVGAISVANFALMGTRLSFGVFFKSLEAEFELTRAMTSSLFSVYWLFCAIFAVIGGWALDRYRPRPIMFLMGLATGSSLLLASQASSFWQIFLSYSLLLAIGTAATFPFMVSTISRWFDKKRGFAFGIAASSGAVGVIVIAPFASYLVASLGWRMSFMVIGVIALVFIVSASMLIRHPRLDRDTFPDDTRLLAGKAEAGNIAERLLPKDSSLKEVFRNKSLWLILTVTFFFAFSLQLVIAHIVPHAMDVGISALVASSIISTMSGANSVSRILIGRISDSMGTKLPSVLSALAFAVVLVVLIWTRELWVLYLAGLVFGLAWGGLTITLSVFVANFFGGRHLGIITGVQNMMMSIGSAAGPFVGGLIFDITGSYFIAFMIAAGTMLLATYLLIIAGHGAKPETELVNLS